MSENKPLFQRADGQNYAPVAAAPKRVVEPGEFTIAAVAFNHGHIFGQVGGLLEAGATLKLAWDEDTERLEKFLKHFAHTGVRAARSLEEILEDPEIQMVVSAAIPCDRGPLGLKVLDAGKDYFTDKSPFTTLDQLAAAREKVQETGRKYMVYYSERLHTESGMFIGDMIQSGAIGKVISVNIMAPHRLAKPTRPEWFFNKSQYGGIITDIGSHQFEQFLTYCGATDGTVNFARVDNYANPDKPGLEDFGEAVITANTGASCYMRVDWFTPDGLPTWGDGRTFILGDKGYIEARKYVDLGRPGNPSNQVFLVDSSGVQQIDCERKVPFRFFGEMILDCLNRTEVAMTQAHIFKAAELSMKAQAYADAIR